MGWNMYVQRVSGNGICIEKASPGDGICMGHNLESNCFSETSQCRNDIEREIYKYIQVQKDGVTESYLI